MLELAAKSIYCLICDKCGTVAFFKVFFLMLVQLGDLLLEVAGTLGLSTVFFVDVGVLC